MSNDFNEIELKGKSLMDKLDIIEQIEESECIMEQDIKKLELLSDDSDEEVRARVAELLVFSDSDIAEKILIKLLEGSDELVRVNACDSLCNSASLEVLNMLKDKVLRDKSSLVRGYAALSVADIAIKLNCNIEELSEFFEYALKKEKVNWVKFNFYKVLYMLGNKSYLHMLIKELNNRQYRNRCAVVNILSELLASDTVVEIKSSVVERYKIEKSIAVKSAIEKVVEYVDEEYKCDEY